MFAGPVLLAEAGALSTALLRTSLQLQAAGRTLWPLPSSGQLLLLLLLAVLEVLAVAGALYGEGLLARAKPLHGAVETLGTAGNGRYHPDSEVEAEEDGFLCGAGGEAVHRVGAGEAATGELGLHLEAVQLPLAHQEANFCHYAKGHVDDVEPPYAPVLSLQLAAGYAGSGASVPLVVVVHGVHEEDQRGGGDEDNVEHPESVLGDGEGHVVAHLLAARLEGVAGKLLLLVLEQVTGDGSQDQDPEHEHEQEPEAAKHRRVGLEGVEESAEVAPFPHDCSTVLGTDPWESGALSALPSRSENCLWLKTETIVSCYPNFMSQSETELQVKVCFTAPASESVTAPRTPKIWNQK